MSRVGLFASAVAALVRPLRGPLGAPWACAAPGPVACRSGLGWWLSRRVLPPLRASGPLPLWPAPLGGPLLSSRSVRAGSCGPPGGPRARFRGCPPVWVLSPGGPSPARFFVRARVPPRLFRAHHRRVSRRPCFLAALRCPFSPSAGGLSPLAPHVRAPGAPAARWRGRWAFSRVRSDRGAHPTRPARRGTRRAWEPGRGSKIPREGERPRRGTLADLLRPAPCASSLRCQNLKALPQIGQYHQYSRTGYPQKGHSGPSGTMIISVLLFSPFYWTVSSWHPVQSVRFIGHLLLTSASGRAKILSEVGHVPHGPPRWRSAASAASYLLVPGRD